MADENIVIKGVVPWGIHPLPAFVKLELESRPSRYASNDVSKFSGTRGIMSPPKSSIRSAWSRVCSNGVPTTKTHPAVNDNGGFVFFGANLPGKGTSNTDPTVQSNIPVNFNSTFGFGSGDQIIGYKVDGNVHRLKSKTFPNRPPPGIDSIETEFYGAGSSFPGLCRKSTIKWRCYSVDQLEYITPYLMGLKVSMVVEWGWNDYSPSSLVDLTNNRQITDLFKFPSPSKNNTTSISDRIKNSRGNYDCHVGRITEYGYTMNSQGNYEGFTVVVSPTSMFDGNSIVNQAVETKQGNAAKSFKEFINTDFDSLSAYFSSTNFKFDPTNNLSPNPSILDFINSLTSNKNKDQYRLFRFTDDDNLNDGGKPSAKFWINFRFFESILNWYATVRDIKGSDALFTFRFSNQTISGHPLLKAVSGDKPANLSVIIPNKFAPRMMRIYSDDATQSVKATTGTSGKLGNISNSPNVSQPDLNYQQTATALKSQLNSKGLVDDFDDLALVTNSVNSFPIFSKNEPIPEAQSSTAMRASAPGYWGYLGDIYISNDLIKRAVEANDTFLKMLEAILGEVSVAGSGVWEYKVIPDSSNGVTIIDNLYCPVWSDMLSKELVTFIIGKTENSSFTDYSMNIKMSQEVALNAMLGAKSSVDPKRADMFVQSDRLYNTEGSFTMANEAEVKLTPEEQAAATEKHTQDEKLQRDTLNARASDNGFVVWHNKNGKDYYMSERDPEFMKQIIQLKPKDSPSVTPLFPGTEFSFTMPGMAGFYYLSLFALDAVPEPYRFNRAVFQVTSVQNTIQNNNWKTSMTAQVRPLSITQ